MPRNTVISDTPHTHVGDLQRDELARTVGIDLAGCNFAVIVHALNEFDRKRIEHLGHRFETWPDDVKAMTEKALADFSARNGGARIEAITSAIGGTPKCFILGLHWRPKV